MDEPNYLSLTLHDAVAVVAVVVAVAVVAIVVVAATIIAAAVASALYSSTSSPKMQIRQTPPCDSYCSG